jgi:N-acetyl-gamma-glutamyl-phosphate reductase
VSWYKPFTHQHLGEINQTLRSLQDHPGEVLFMPLRGNFTRGIFSTAYTAYQGTLKAANEAYADFYANAPFTQISDQQVHLKQVINTNYAYLHLHLHHDILLVTSVIDNLLKGASGQAVQNMNLMFGLDQTTGLSLKGSAF